MPTETIKEGLLNLEIQAELLDFSAYQTIKECAQRVQSDSNLRGLALFLDCDGDNLENMGEVPVEYAHRSPSGSHGIGPIVQQEALNALFRCMKPTVAFLSNHVFGPAIDLAAFCDIRWIRSDIQLCDDRILQGRTASTGITYLLPRLVGLSQAMRVLLLGETLNAGQLLNMQFAHEVVPVEDWDSKVDLFCRKIGRMATRAYEVHKMQVLPQLDLPHDAAMTHSLGVRQTHVIKDRAEGIQAWRERREPEFKGE